jgi:hypothetical protein
MCPGPAIAAIGLGKIIPAASIFLGFVTALVLEGTQNNEEMKGQKE